MNLSDFLLEAATPGQLIQSEAPTERNLFRFDIDTFNNVVCTSYNIQKRTPKGVWIDIPYQGKKFVNLECRKQFANETQEEALQAFTYRKRRQISILKGQLSRAKIGLKIANDYVKGVEPAEPNTPKEGS